MSKLTPKNKAELRARRHRRIRAKVKGSSERPRLSVFRSNKFLYAQLINDDARVTVASANSTDIKGKTMLEDAREVGTRIAKAALEKGVSAVVFDRGGFTYGGVIRTFADAAREAGLKF